MTVQTWRCHTCGRLLASWAAAQRHGDHHGGGRLDLVLAGALNCSCSCHRAVQPGLVPCPHCTGEETDR